MPLSTIFQLYCDGKYLLLKENSTPDKFDQFLEDNFLSGRAISMTLCMKITVIASTYLDDKKNTIKNILKKDGIL
jgi:hypothetical protein